MILALLVLGLAWTTRGEVSLARAFAGKLRAYGAARAGVVYAGKLLAQYPAAGADVLGAVGLRSPERTNPLVLSDVPVGEGAYFSLLVPAGLYSGGSRDEFGLSDEAGLFNLNMVDSPESPAAYVFEELVNALEPGSGSKWREALTGFKTSAGEGYLTRTLYFPEDLFLIAGMSEALFKRLKGHVTVLPRETSGQFRINLYTAPDIIVKAAFEGLKKYAKISADMSGPAGRFLQCRKEAADREDPASARCELPDDLSGFELGPFRSGVYRVRSMGVDEKSGLRSLIEAVIMMDQFQVKVLAWHRE
jgi:type II secretory pathway component PulK